MCQIMPLGPNCQHSSVGQFYLLKRMHFASTKCPVEKLHRTQQSKDQRQKNPSPRSTVLCLSKLSMIH